jgi:predicted metalloprotease
MNQDDFVDKIHYYGLLHTICTREISTVGKNDPHMLNQLDKEVRDTWNADPSNPLYHPADNAEAELEFYKKCDTICKTEAHSVQEYVSQCSGHVLLRTLTLPSTPTRTQLA